MCYESYYFTGDDSNRLKTFLGEMLNQIKEINHENFALFSVEYGKQNKINEFKIDNYIDRMQQPLISDKLKEEIKKYILAQPIRFLKSNYL